MNAIETRRVTPNASFDIDLPLHPDTDNGEHVALLVHGILGDIEAMIAGHGTSQQDIVQALTIATAIRAAMAEVNSRTGKAMNLDLLDVSVGEPRLDLLDDGIGKPRLN